MKIRLLLWPFSVIYATIAAVRNFLFDKNIFKKTGFEKPVILVGNLSVGGTGKTPHVEYLIRLLKKDFKIATLSRGFGRKTKGFVLGGKGAGVNEIGDEPLQYLSKFEDITVAVCEERVAGANKLFALPSAPDVIIMDDGFQHRQIKPGFSILLTSYDHLFTKDYVLPAGDLREKRSGYKRADCIIVTKCPHLPGEEEKLKICNEINPLEGQSLFFSGFKYTALNSVSSYDIFPLENLVNRHVLLFTGIANSEPLFLFLKSKCMSVNEVKFPDHHSFSVNDMLQLKGKFDMFARDSTIMVTTEKDYQRLKGTPLLKIIAHLPCYFIPVEIEIDNHQKFNSIIINYVTKNKGNS
ncbi:MAG: tetraacyldisaccharide 4'-kinase [Bacteroidetes bacterium]|nr:tetraacyldisaccharide 4'-kinase [Bacteroidota bacterium]